MINTTCKICSNKTHSFEVKQNIKYYYCYNCDFISIDESKIPAPEKEKERYLEHNNGPDQEGYIQMFKRFIKEYITPHKNRISTTLDYGCGHSPILASLLKEQGFNVDIYDLYFAPEKVYENKKYNLITCTEVIEHLKDPLKTIKIQSKHLGEKGILALTTLFHPGNIQEFIPWWYHSDETHISFFTHKTMQYIAKLSDLKIIRIDSKNTCLLEKK